MQRFAATWSEEQLAGHRRANAALHSIVRAAFDLVGQALRRGDQHRRVHGAALHPRRFEREGLWSESDPIVGVNAHSADPHYQPEPDLSVADRTAATSCSSTSGPRRRRPGSVYADITWVGVCAPSPTERQQEVFRTVAAARDAAWQLVASRYPR